jgi:hypothetical protein
MIFARFFIFAPHLTPAPATGHDNDQEGDYRPDRHHHDEDDPGLARPVLLALMS